MDNCRDRRQGLGHARDASNPDSPDLMAVLRCLLCRPLLFVSTTLIFAWDDLAGALRFGWISLNWFSLSYFAIIVLVLGFSCSIIVCRPKESLNFARSQVGIVSSAIALIFAFLPLGCWWSAGTIRWQGGCPFFFILLRKLFDQLNFAVNELLPK